MTWVEIDGHVWVTANDAKPLGSFMHDHKTWIVNNPPTARFWRLRWEGRLPRKTKKALARSASGRPVRSLRNGKRLRRAIGRAFIDAAV